jgi:hypothetical protein
MMSMEKECLYLFLKNNGIGYFRPKGCISRSMTHRSRTGRLHPLLVLCIAGRLPDEKAVGRRCTRDNTSCTDLTWWEGCGDATALSHTYHPSAGDTPTRRFSSSCGFRSAISPHHPISAPEKNYHLLDHIHSRRPVEPSQ